MRAKHALGDRVEPMSPNFSLDDISMDESMVNLSDLSPKQESRHHSHLRKDEEHIEHDENDDFLRTKNT